MIHDMRIRIVSVVLLVAMGATVFAMEPMQKPIYVQGVGGYNNYRIPSLLATQAGTLLAFCEAREAGDSSDIDLLVRRSEDSGKTWSRKQVVWDEGHNVYGNPCPVQDRDTGVIWLLMTWNDSSFSNSELHQGKGDANRRVFVCYSKDDGGATWSRLRFDDELIEPVCQGSFLRYSRAVDGDKNRLLFSNPASTKGRVNMTVRLSHDEGKTWPVAKSLHAGPSAYSCLAVLPDGDIGCFYEGGDTRYGDIVFARFSLAWLMDESDILKSGGKGK